MPSSQKSSATTTEPWQEQKPYLQRAFSEASRLYNQGGAQYYPGSTVASMTPYQNAGLNLTASRALYGNPNVNMGGKQIGNILSGDLGLDAVYKNIESKVLPSAMSAYSAAGRTPGGAGSYGGYAAEQLANAYAPVAAQQFNNALSLAPQYAANDYADINALYGAGSNIQAQNQAQINEAINRYQYNQNLPWDQLQKYLSLIQGSYGDTRTSPYYTNPGASAASGALSGALGGAAAGSVIPGIGTGIGALMGGLLGGGGGLFSNSEFKEDITPIDGAEALETVKNLPISSWKYKPEFSPDDRGQHVGPMAEDLHAATGRGNATTINLADEVGLLAAAFKELARRNDKRSRS